LNLSAPLATAVSVHPSRTHLHSHWTSTRGCTRTDIAETIPSQPAFTEV